MILHFRHRGGSLNHPASWSDYDNWPFSADAWLLRPGWLAIDLVVAAELDAIRARHPRVTITLRLSVKTFLSP